MTSKLTKSDLAYNACVEGINELDPMINEMLNERNKLAKAADTICPLRIYKQHKIVGD